MIQINVGDVVIVKSGKSISSNKLNGKTLEVTRVSKDGYVADFAGISNCGGVWFDECTVVSSEINIDNYKIWN